MSYSVGLKNCPLIATRDADVVARIREAGGIPLLVSNTPELCMWWHTFNKVTGATRNPYDTRRTPGGSSGGEVGTRFSPKRVYLIDLYTPKKVSISLSTLARSCLSVKLESRKVSFSGKEHQRNLLPVLLSFHVKHKMFSESRTDMCRGW